jgi:hypothetical protein
MSQTLSQITVAPAVSDTGSLYLTAQPTSNLGLKTNTVFATTALTFNPSTGVLSLGATSTIVGGTLSVNGTSIFSGVVTANSLNATTSTVSTSKNIAVSVSGNVPGAYSSFSGQFYGTTASGSQVASYLLTPATSNLEFGSNNFTIEFWWWPASTTRQALYHGSFGTDWSIGIDFNGTGVQSIGIWASSNGTNWNLLNADPGGNTVGSLIVNQNSWNHVVYQRIGNQWQSYLNGVLDKNVTVAGSIVNRSSSQKTIGSWWNTTAMSTASGYISNFRIVNGTAIYNGTFTPPTAPLTAVTNTQLLLLTTNSVVKDSSTNNFNITNNGYVAVTNISPFTTGALNTVGGAGINGNMAVSGTSNFAGPVYIGTPAALSYTGLGGSFNGNSAFVNGTGNAVLSYNQKIGQYPATSFSISQATPAINNTAVTSFRFFDMNNNQFGTAYIAGSFYVYAVGASGANSFYGVYDIISGGNGTPNAVLTAHSGSPASRGTNPVSTVTLANDGGGGGISLVVTTINNSGVVTGGAINVTFIGMAT